MKVLGATPYICVADVERSLAFYRDLLGFEVVNTMEWEGRTTWARITNGPFGLMLSSGAAGSLEHDDDDDHAHATWQGPRHAEGIDIFNATWFDVLDVDAVYDELKSAGADILYPPADRHYGVRDFMVRDPDGYYYVVGSRIDS
jgi:uncharacterized glyoxalase superfamily protein PhnB